MGNYGGVIAFAPVASSPKPGTRKQICLDLVALFERQGVLKPGAAERVTFETEPQNRVLDLVDKGVPEGFEWAEAAVETSDLTTRIEEIVLPCPLYGDGFWSSYLRKLKMDPGDPGLW